MTIILIKDMEVDPCDLLRVSFGIPLHHRLGCFSEGDSCTSGTASNGSDPPPVATMQVKGHILTGTLDALCIGLVVTSSCNTFKTLVYPFLSFFVLFCFNLE